MAQSSIKTRVLNMLVIDAGLSINECEKASNLVALDAKIFDLTFMSGLFQDLAYWNIYLCSVSLFL